MRSIELEFYRHSLIYGRLEIVFFKLLFSLVIDRFVEQERDGQFFAQYRGRETGGPTIYGRLWYRNYPADQKTEGGIS